MNIKLTTTAAAIALGATMLVPFEAAARPGPPPAFHHHHHHGPGPAGFFAAGLFGMAVGAALASEPTPVYRQTVVYTPPAPVYVQQPVYVRQPAPVYVQQPAPVYVQQPAPVYVQQPQVIYQPAPVYVAPTSDGATYAPVAQPVAQPAASAPAAEQTPAAGTAQTDATVAAPAAE